MYSVNFTVTRKKFCLSSHYNRVNSYLFVNGTEIHKFKAKRFWDCGSSVMPRKHFKILVGRLYIKNGFNGYIYDFSVDYDAIAFDDILDIQGKILKFST